jgi:endonuclease/exonuclease/phosphatase family metal-dependent hydrolase
VKPPDGAPLVVYGTVLPWLGSPWRDFPADDGMAFRAALAAQLADWIALVRQFPGGDLCVLGDLNQDLSRRDYYGSRGNRLALLDALRTVGLSALTADPADPVRAVARDRASIDHICVPVRVVQQGSARLWVWPPGAAPDRRLSDHYGVAADLTFGG